MLVVSYHTDDAYMIEAERLADSVRRVGMSLYAETIRKTGDWYDATRYKAVYLRRIREVYRGTLLYVDADAILHRRIDDYEFDHTLYDLGAHYHHRGRKLGSGTLFLADTAGCRRVLDRWIAINQMKLQKGRRRYEEQASLSEALDQMADVRAWRMPARYCYITDLSKGWDPDEPVVIEHLQASREFRNPGKNSRLLPARQRRLRELGGTQ